MQRAAEAGAVIGVVYITDGENNPWPQLMLLRRRFLSYAERPELLRLVREVGA